MTELSVRPTIAEILETIRWKTLEDANATLGPHGYYVVIREDGRTSLRVSSTGYEVANLASRDDGSIFFDRELTAINIDPKTGLARSIFGGIVDATALTGLDGHLNSLQVDAEDMLPLNNTMEYYRTENASELPLPANSTVDELVLRQAVTPPKTVDAKSDERTVNNVMRHAYRVLSDEEKATMQKVKDMGLEFHDFINGMGNSRELSIAKTKVEEAVMWAIKDLTK